MTKTAHPGRTPAQRRALDRIGCGDLCPPMHPRVRDALLSARLIEQRGMTTIGCDTLGAIRVPAYEMPYGVHFLWCSAVSQDFDPETAQAPA